MSIEQILKILAALYIIATGLYSLLQPHATAKLVALTIDAQKGVAEIRAAFGANLIGLGTAVLILHQPVAYQTVGIVALCVTVMRLVAIPIDRVKVDRTWVGAILADGVIALIMLT